MSDNTTPTTTENEVLGRIASAMENQARILEVMQNKEDTKVKTPAGVHTAIRLHGSSGIFSVCGLEREILTAHVRPQGIESVLPVIPSNLEDPRFGTITGFTDVTGSEPDNACDEAPYAYMKGCNLTARFGMIRRDTNTVEMDKVMLKLHRGDFTDLVLKGRLLGMTDLVPSGLSESDVLNVITMAEMVTAGVATERVLMNQLWQGSALVANEFPGLDSQIATGQMDADTGIACPALDSDVKDFNLADVSDGTIVTIMSTLMWYLQYNAQTMGLEPVEWVVVMRPDLWYELTAIWPCAYNTNRCAAAAFTGSTTFIDGRENVSERDRMREGMYLVINGRRFPVIVDTGIFEHNSTNNGSLIPGEFASSIYVVPLTVLGNFPVTYREYVDYRGAARDTNLLRGMEDFWWTDSGIYSWAIEQVKWCYKLSLKTEQRVILRAPQLAGRIDNVKYTPTQHLRDSDPDGAYFRDGGVSIRGALGEPLAIWATR